MNVSDRTALVLALRDGTAAVLLADDVSWPPGPNGLPVAETCVLSDAVSEGLSPEVDWSFCEGSAKLPEDASFLPKFAKGEVESALD